MTGPLTTPRPSLVVLVALGSVTALSVYDVLAGPDLVLAGLLTAGPPLTAGTGSRRAVWGVGAYTLLCFALLSWPDQLWWTRGQLLYLLAMLVITAVSAVVAGQRHRQDLRTRTAQAQFTSAFRFAGTGMALLGGSGPGPTDVARATADDPRELGGPVPGGSGAPATLLAVNDALAGLVDWRAGPPPGALHELVVGEPADPQDRQVELDDGRVVVAVVTSTTLPSDPDSGALRLVQVSDVTGQREAARSMTRMALHDQLTGLANRALLRDRLAHALSRSRRTHQRVGLLFLDLDRFKNTNDALGHEAGDALLVEVAARLATAVRPGDTVCRLGGDEFVVLLEEVADQAEAGRVATRLQAALVPPVALGGELVRVSASIGVAVAAGPDTSPDVLLRDADTAMYHAKGRGRGRAELFDEVLRRDLLERVAVEAGLHRALENAELRVHLQPVVEPSTGRVAGAEALVRWERPGHGLVLPSTFVPVAEDCGLIGRIDGWVLDEAIRQAVQYRRHRRDPDFELSVNVSAAELADASLPATIARSLQAHGLPSDRLVLEVTETTYAEAVGSTLAALQQLRGMRVRLALDDFGTGYSSLTYIKRYPFDVIKIDQSFVRGMLTDPVDAGIVDGVVGLASALGMTTVAEGVETPELARSVEALNCRRGQGFTWSRAVPLHELIELPDLLPAT